MSRPRLEQITEARASFLYVEHVFTESGKGWASMRKVFLNYSKPVADMLGQVSHPEALLTVVVLGSNLNSILNYSPIFKDRHEQARRIEEWILFCLLSDFPDRTPWPPEETLVRLRRYQHIDASLIQQLQQTGKNPFGDLTGVFLCDLFGDGVEKLCRAGENCLDNLLFSLLADLFTITCTSSFSYWKMAYGKYDIVSGGLPTPTRGNKGIF
jgi:hypothetical protein